MYKKNKLNIVFCSILVLFTFYACGTYSLKWNGQKKYIKKCYENKMEFRAIGVRGTSCIIYFKAKKGDFIFNTDSLVLIEYPQYKDINKRFTQFRYNNNDVIGVQLIEQGKTLRLSFFYGEYGCNSPVTKEILIPPSNFIMCGDKPIITDTLRIQLKN